MRGPNVRWKSINEVPDPKGALPSRRVTWNKLVRRTLEFYQHAFRWRTDLTGMAVFPASKEADYILAQTYNVDGGQWMS